MLLKKDICLGDFKVTSQNANAVGRGYGSRRLELKFRLVTIGLGLVF